MKISTEKYLLYSSIFAVFTEAFFFNYIIDLKLFYLLILINSVLLIKLKKITINSYFLLLIGFFLVHGILAYLIIGIPINYMLSQVIGISITGIYYYNFVSFFPKSELIKVYTKLSLYVSIVGYLLWALNINLNDGERLQSIFKEPAHYAIVVIPACYYYLKQKKYLSFATIFGTLVLSQSSIGYIGCFLMIVLPYFNFKRLTYLCILLPFALGTFYLIYLKNPAVKLRFDDTYHSLSAVSTGKFAYETNQSTYALLSNAFVTKKNFESHPLGTGIGSHFYMHTYYYYYNMRPPSYLKVLKSDKINAPDAASLFLRIVSEFGLFGLLFVIYFIYLLINAFSNTSLFFNQGLMIFFLLKLLRDGHYFPPEMFFFVWLLFYPKKVNHD